MTLTCFNLHTELVIFQANIMELNCLSHPQFSHSFKGFYWFQRQHG